MVPVAVAVAVPARRVSEPVAAVLLSSASLPAPSAVGATGGFAMLMSPWGSAKHGRFARAGSDTRDAEQGPGSPGLLRFPPPAAIHGLCGASLQLDRVKRLYPKSPSARQKPRVLSALRGKNYFVLNILLESKHLLLPAAPGAAARWERQHWAFSPFPHHKGKSQLGWARGFGQWRGPGGVEGLAPVWRRPRGRNAREHSPALGMG